MKKILNKLYSASRLLQNYASVFLTRSNAKTAYVFGAPFHSNMGDQAQSYCTEKWINRYYPEYSVRIYDTLLLERKQYHFLNWIRKNLHNDDLIFLHSGYHTTDLYMREENLQRKVISSFNDRRIVLLPQTINYIDEKEAQKSISIYNAHNNLIILCRDTTSFSLASTLFKHAKLLLFPDIVTTMIGTKQYSNIRSGVLLCLRNDKEAFYSKKEIESLTEHLSEFTSVDITDTTINAPAQDIMRNRVTYLEKIWDQYSRYQLIITDRYHGTIFSLIANTPAIVISSTDHKLKSGVDWFPVSFKDYVQYVPDLSDVVKTAKIILNKKLDHFIPDFFNVEYYSKLKGLLEETHDTHL